MNSVGQFNLNSANGSTGGVRIASGINYAGWMDIMAGSDCSGDCWIMTGQNTKQVYLRLGHSYSTGYGADVLIGAPSKSTYINSGTTDISSNTTSIKSSTTTIASSTKTTTSGPLFEVNNTDTWINSSSINLAGMGQTTVRSPTFWVDPSCNLFYCDASYSQIRGKKLSIESKNVVIDQEVIELYADARNTYFYGSKMNIRTPSLNIDASCSNFIVKAINTDLTGTNATATTQEQTDTTSNKLATCAFVHNSLTSDKNVTFGTITGTTITGTSFNATSDYRIKSNITSLDETYTVDNLNPVTYLNKQTDKQDIGLIAHELQEKYPMLVNGTKDGDSYQNVNYLGLIPVLIKEIQNLKQTVTDLNQRIKTLEEKP